MRVGIDARKIADYGIGTYIRGLLRGVVELNTGDQYVAFAPAGAPIPNQMLVEATTPSAPACSTLTQTLNGGPGGVVAGCGTRFSCISPV